MEPNRFECFLFKVDDLDIKFSSSSLSDVANLNSKYLFISVVSVFL